MPDRVINDLHIKTRLNITITLTGFSTVPTFTGKKVEHSYSIMYSPSHWCKYLGGMGWTRNNRAEVTAVTVGGDCGQAQEKRTQAFFF